MANLFIQLSKGITALIGLLILALFHSFHGQSTNSLIIEVVDQNSAPITQVFARLKDEKGKVMKEISNTQLKEITFAPISAGKYILEIESVGFKANSRIIEIKVGRNLLKVVLEIEEIKVDIDVKQDDVANRLEQAFSGNLSRENIDALPNNPQEIEAELKRKYGDDIIIQIDGFSGGQMPPKDQIESIKVIRSVFDVEFHEVGKTVVKVKTKGGKAAKWFGFTSFVFGDSRLNARNSFEQIKLPQQNRIIIAFAGGPLIKNKTAIHFGFFNIANSRKNNIIAVVPDKTIVNQAKSGINLFLPSVGIDHTFNENHSLNLSYNIEKTNLSNLGIGGISLPERGFSNTTMNHRVRLSESGTINKKYVNEFRVELLDSQNSITPNTREVGITVLNTFSSGGAIVDNRSRQQKLYLIDNVLFDRNNHSFKFGGELEVEKRRTFSADNTNGSFVFSSLTDYQNNRPATFTQRQGTSQTAITQTQIALYAQDDWRLLRNLQIGVGLRYEWQNNLRDFNNFSPRLSFSYSPTKTGVIVFRTGIGIFYQWLDTQNLNTILNNDGRQSSDLIIRNPSYPNPFLTGIISQSLAPSITTKAQNLVNPTTFVVHTGFNLRVAKNLNLETFYKFQRGIHQFRSRDINAPINNQRPNSKFGRISQVESSGTFSENALEISADGNILKSVVFNLRYKLAKNINNYDGMFDLPSDNYNLSLERGFSNLDRRHRLTGNLNFTLFKKLQVTPIFRLESPVPYTIITGKDNNGDTVFNDRPNGLVRNSERGDWLRQVDLRLGWRVPLRKEKTSTTESSATDKVAKNLFGNSIGIDITVGNFLNQNNKQNFVGNQLSPFFRQATTSAPARSLQISLNWLF